jgi:hypothetical protein
MPVNSISHLWSIPPRTQSTPAQPETYNQGESSMKQHVVKVFAVMAAVMFLSITVLELNSEARMGGGRTFGSRGSRSYSMPAPASPLQGLSRQPSAPGPSPFQQQAGGGFMRSMAGGVMGGMLGSMLFGGSAGAGAGTDDGGIGLSGIILLAGGGYLLYRLLKKKPD